MKGLITIISCLLLTITIQAQNDHDAIMMNKHQWCNGISYEHSQWKNYWEGTLKRDNENIGAFTSQSAVFMTNYGITNKLNIMASLPHVWNQVSGGTLHKMDGLQDVSLALKWKPVALKYGASKLSLYAVGGISAPTHNYVVDFLPLSIGFGSTNATGRAIADYQLKTFFITGSAAYTVRSNTRIDRTAYYTDHMIYSNKVAMPDMFNSMLSAGLRSRYLVAEAMVSNTVTQKGGFDIRRNDMPFPSNRMNMTSVGAHIKYTLPFYKHVELTADGSRVVKGRNVGQATNFGAGVFYLFTFNKKITQPATHS